MAPLQRGAVTGPAALRVSREVLTNRWRREVRRRLQLGLASASLGCSVLMSCSASTQRIVLQEPSAHSTPDAFSARRGVQLLPEERRELAYELSGESFERYEPDSRERRGLQAGLVWISASRSGAPPRIWGPVLERLGVVWVGANAAGNRRAPPDRINLALDAADHVRGILGEGPPLIVAGFSGGARIASELAVLYPDIFDAGLYSGAADYFRYVRSSDPRWSAWEPSFPAPPAALFERARSRRYVFFTGSRDVNRALVRDVHRAYLEDGFSAAVLVEIADFGHDLPPPECFERALGAVMATEPAALRRLTGLCS
jgi:hypothetical protein